MKILYFYLICLVENSQIRPYRIDFLGKINSRTCTPIRDCRVGKFPWENGIFGGKTGHFDGKLANFGIF